MKRGTARGFAIGCIALCITASLLQAAGYLSATVSGGIIILSFPPGVLFLGFWWRAGEKDPDLPFVGW